MRMGLESDLDSMTLLYYEMNICAEYLHCTHEEFQSLPRAERLKWYYYAELRGKKEQNFYMKQRDKLSSSVDFLKKGGRKKYR